MVAAMLLSHAALLQSSHSLAFIQVMTQSSTKSEIATAYNEWAETYDTNPNRTRDLAAQVLRQANLDFAGRNLIEVGCGTGCNTEWLARPAAGAAGIVALDFSEEMLARARNRVIDPRVRFVQHDVRTTWPAPDAAADLVIAMLILEHVEDIKSIAAEAARTLTAGGELFICELHPMRQLLGGQAQFNNSKTGLHHRVPAFLHDVSDYINVGLGLGFELVSLGEWRDSEATRTSPPRILSLLFRLPASHAQKAGAD
jgi:ubiquinone/menaquinone biosynthesis C-methylase UbiE